MFAPRNFPFISELKYNLDSDQACVKSTVKPVHTGMPWGQTFIPVWTGSGLERVFAFGEEQTTITCTIGMRVLIQDVSSVGIQMIGGCMQIN